MKNRCGTPGFFFHYYYYLSYYSYMAPEIFYNKGYDDKVDIFSAGIILYLMQYLILI